MFQPLQQSLLRFGAVYRLDDNARKAYQTVIDYDYEPLPFLYGRTNDIGFLNGAHCSVTDDDDCVYFFTRQGNDDYASILEQPVQTSSSSPVSYKKQIRLRQIEKARKENRVIDITI